jgi:hypothetical protein
MAKRGSPKAYRGIIHCLTHNFSQDGIRGLQRGLSYGMMREFFFTGSRIGFNDIILSRYLAYNGRQNPTPTERFAIGQTVGE